MTFRGKLIELGAFREAREWVGDRTLEQSWAECQRADLLLWLAGKVGVDRRLIVGTAVAVARDVLPLFEAARPGDGRVRKCLDACERYAAGEEIDLRPYARGAARAAAYAAYAAAYAAAAADAADATTYAAYAAYAAYATARAAYADAATRARHADIVRARITVEQIKEKLQ